MRTTVAAILFLLLMAPALMKIGILTWYEANIDYVSRTLCENRDRPMMHCNGKCFLKKQLEKADGLDAQGKARLAEISKIELPAFLLPAIFQLRPAIPEKESFGFAYQEPSPEEVILRIFHPPS